MMPVMERELIIFEQPLNESIRLCLRLEHLFALFHQEIHESQSNSSQLAMNTLLKLLEVIDRPDIKSKITQALSQHATTLAQLQNIPGVDPQRLQSVLAELDASLSYFHGKRQRIGEELRSNSFLMQLCGHINNPAGLCSFSTPAFTLWCRKPAQARHHDLLQWYSVFDALETAVTLILRLTRDSASANTIDVVDGFYHQALDSALPTQLVRISIDASLGVYPEMSVGKHHLSVRFMQTNDHNGNAEQYQQAFQCLLSCCRV